MLDIHTMVNISQNIKVRNYKPKLASEHHPVPWKSYLELLSYSIAWRSPARMV